MAPSKSTRKPAPADPLQSQCTTIQLVKHAERDLTYNEMYYRQTQINLCHQEIALAKAERDFREQPWWDRISFCAAGIACVAVLTTIVLGGVGFYFDVIRPAISKAHQN